MLVVAAGTASAQQQESGLLDRIDHPDRTLAFPLTNKSFTKTATYKNREAAIRPFAFTKNTTAGGIGSYRTKPFESSGYKTKDYDLRDKSAGQKSFAQTNKLFDTQNFDVRDARDANKTMSVGTYDTRQPFIAHGKRQDTYDEMLKKKKLSIEEVRELLNKNK